MYRFDAQNGPYSEVDMGVIRAAILPMVGLRQDAVEGYFFARALDYIKAQTYDVLFPELNGLKLVPANSGYPESTSTITYRTWTMAGMSKIIANYADDLPRADVAGNEKSTPVRTIGEAYGYNVMELIQSAATGSQIDSRKAKAARRAHDEKISSMALVGDADYGLTGITNNPNVSLTTPVTGAWSAVGTTGDQIVVDLLAGYNAVPDQSNEIHYPTAIALPTLAYRAMNSKKTTSGATGLTVTAWQQFLSFIGDMGREKPVAFQIRELKTAGAAGTSRAIWGEFNLQNCEMPIPMPFNQLPPQARNLEAVVPCIGRAGSVIIYYPLAFTYMDGVN
jgi:hypothetical protein